MKCHIINTVALIFLAGHSIVSAQSDEFFPGDPNYSLLN